MIAVALRIFGGSSSSLRPARSARPSKGHMRTSQRALRALPTTIAAMSQNSGYSAALVSSVPKLNSKRLVSDEFPSPGSPSGTSVGASAVH